MPNCDASTGEENTEFCPSLVLITFFNEPNASTLACSFLTASLFSRASCSIGSSFILVVDQSFKAAGVVTRTVTGLLATVGWFTSPFIVVTVWGLVTVVDNDDNKLLKFGRPDDVMMTCVILIGIGLDVLETLSNWVGSGTRMIPSSITTDLSCGAVLHKSTQRWNINPYNVG